MSYVVVDQSAPAAPCEDSNQMTPLIDDTVVDLELSRSKTIVFIDHRTLIRECMIAQIRLKSNFPTVLGFANVADWQDFQKNEKQASVIMISAASRSIRQMTSELDTIETTSPGSAIILLSEIDDYFQVIEAVQRGLRGFIPITSPVNVAISALALVMAGGCFIPSDTVCKNPARSLTTDEKPHGIKLTEREIAVLYALKVGKPNKIIAYELQMCTNTVKVHVRNIMKKLQAKNRTELAYLVNTAGIGLHSIRSNRTSENRPIAT
jgi:DNA-binding NarL/FixJ family response regulator